MHLWMLVTRTSVFKPLSAVELRFRCKIGPMFAVSEHVWLKPLVTEQLSRTYHNTIGSCYVLTRFRLVLITYLHSVVCEGLLQGRMQTQPRGPQPTICNIAPCLATLVTQAPMIPSSPKTPEWTLQMFAKNPKSGGLRSYLAM